MVTGLPGLLGILLVCYSLVCWAPAGVLQPGVLQLMCLAQPPLTSCTPEPCCCTLLPAGLQVLPLQP